VPSDYGGLKRSKLLTAVLAFNFNLNTVRVTAKPDLGFSPKRGEEREVPAQKQLIGPPEVHPCMNGSRFVFPSPRGNRELHLLGTCKAIADLPWLHFQFAKVGDAGLHQVPIHFHEVILYAAGFGRGEEFLPVDGARSDRHDFLLRR